MTFLYNRSARTKGVIVAHPGRQHSHQLAAALHQIGALQRYCTQKPPLEYFDRLPSFLKMSGLIGSPHGSSAGIPLGKISLKLSRSLAASVLFRTRKPTSREVEIRNHDSFDRWVARRVRRVKPYAVVGYEGACSETLAAAKECGVHGILDAASFHFRAQDEMLAKEGCFDDTAAAQEIRRRKLREIQLADWIFCASPLARDSYVANGVRPEKIVVQTLGYDPTRFFPAIGAAPRSGPLRIAFVGLPVKHKGFDHLLAAADVVWKAGIPFELHVFGDREAALKMGAGPVARKLYLRGAIAQAQLATDLRDMDCIVLPSLFDSFAMAVVEAMGTGLPAIVSEMVGAKMAVRQGETGWIVPVGDIDALSERIARLASDSASVRNMSSACFEAASAYDWKNYHLRIQNFFSGLPGFL